MLMNERNGHKRKAVPGQKRLGTPEPIWGGASIISISDGQTQVHFISPARVFGLVQGDSVRNELKPISRSLK
jgi:hypothetical protein